MRTNSRRQTIPIFIEFAGQKMRSELFATEAERSTDISLKVREEGWKPYRVRFDDKRPAWIVSSLVYREVHAPR
jgi:hypothetical protein